MSKQYVVFNQDDRAFLGAPTLFFNSKEDAETHIERQRPQDAARYDVPRRYAVVAIPLAA